MPHNVWLYLPVNIFQISQNLKGAYSQLYDVVLCTSQVKVIQWTPDLLKSFPGYMGVNLCRLTGMMTEQCLDVPDVCTTFQQMRGKTVTQRVQTGLLSYSRLLQRAHKYFCKLDTE